MQITSKIESASVKVYANDILHIHFMRDQFVGLQSYQYGAEPMFYIEITLEGGVISCDYDQREMWINILAELDKVR